MAPAKSAAWSISCPRAKAATDGDVSGEVTATYGSYSKRNLTGQIGVPLDLGFATGGVHAYGELDDSFSYYRGIHPSHQLLELTGNFASRPLGAVVGLHVLPFQWRCADAGLEPPHPGADRQRHLHHRQQHFAFRPTAAASLTFNDLGGNPYTFSPTYTPLYIASPGCGACTDATHTLDSGLGTTYLDRRTVYIDPGVDFSNTITHTGFAELARSLDDGDRIRLQGFVDTLSNDRFVSYGFPASYRTLIGETRARYDFARRFRRRSPARMWWAPPIAMWAPSAKKASTAA